MNNFNKYLLAAVFTCATLPVPNIGSPVAQAQTTLPNVVPGRSLGRVYLGYTPAQVHKALGKPSKTLKLRNGLLDDIYLARKKRARTKYQTVRDKVEVLYRAGRVVQIEATSPVFETRNGLSTNSPFRELTRSNAIWRVLVYSYEIEEGWQNFYFVDQKTGLSFEFEKWQEQLVRDANPSTVIVHRAGTRPIPDVGGELITDSLDLSVVMSQYENN